MVLVTLAAPIPAAVAVVLVVLVEMQPRVAVAQAVPDSSIQSVEIIMVQVVAVVPIADHLR